MKKPKSILSNLPTCNISSDFDHCLPFILFPQPPLGLANHGWDVGARLGVGHSSERERERERERSGGNMPDPGKCCGWQFSASLERGLSTGSSVWSACPSKTNLKPNTRFGTHGAKKKRENKVCSLFQKVDPGIPGCVPLLLVFFLFKQTAWLLRSSKSH